MPSYFWTGVAKGVDSLQDRVEKGLDARRDRIKRSQQRDEAVQFIEGLKGSGIGIDQLSSVNPESGAVGLKQPGTDLMSMLALLGGEGEKPGVGRFTRLTKGGLTFEAPKRLPQGQVSSIQEAQESLRQIQQLTKMFEDNPDVETGPFSLAFRRSGILAGLGNLGLQYGTEPKKAERITKLVRMSNRAQDQYRRAVTASQAGFPEIKFLQTSFASPERERRDNLLSSYGIAEQDLQGKISQMLTTLEEAGYDVSGLMDNVNTQGQSGQEGIPQEILNQLPPGAKVRRVR